MKCGKKLGESQVFCDECLQRMSENPVPQDAVVKLPHRPSAPVVKKKAPKRRYFWNIEGENDTLRTKIRWLRFAFIVTFFALLLAIALILMLVFWREQLEYFISLLPF